MGIVGKAITGYRDVIVTFNGVTQPIDAYKACLKRVEEIEAKYALDSSSVSDLATVASFIVGNDPSYMYEYDVTLTIATGEYNFNYYGLRGADGSAIAS